MENNSVQRKAGILVAAVFLLGVVFGGVGTHYWESGRTARTPYRISETCRGYQAAYTAGWVDARSGKASHRGDRRRPRTHARTLSTAEASGRCDPRRRTPADSRSPHSRAAAQVRKVPAATRRRSRPSRKPALSLAARHRYRRDAIGVCRGGSSDISRGSAPLFFVTIIRDVG